jgi:hypothetical protein
MGPIEEHQLTLSISVTNASGRLAKLHIVIFGDKRTVFMVLTRKLERLRVKRIGLPLPRAVRRPV